jgi:hypothetical protein
MELYLRTLMRQVDSSLLEEWERCGTPATARSRQLARPREEAAARRRGGRRDITRDAALHGRRPHRIFTLPARLVHRRARRGARAARRRRRRRRGRAVDGRSGCEAVREAYRVEHDGLRLDPEARNLRHTYVRPSGDDRRTWRVQQMLRRSRDATTTGWRGVRVGTSPLLARDSVFFTPSVVAPTSPTPRRPRGPWATWSRRRRGPPGSTPRRRAAIDAGFGPTRGDDARPGRDAQGTHHRRAVRPGIGIHTPLESWSMGKSLTGTLVARLIQMGDYTLEQPRPSRSGSSRAIRGRRSASWTSCGCRAGSASARRRIRATTSRSAIPTTSTYYTGTVNSFEWAATRPQQWKPNTVGRYRNTDPVLASYLVRLAPRSGARTTTLPAARALRQDRHPRRRDLTDPYGNFLTQGLRKSVAARDWARLANLYLQDGVWNGERLLPAGYVEHVKTIAPAWVADGRPVYGGGFFWVNGDGGDPMPRDASRHARRGRAERDDHPLARAGRRAHRQVPRRADKRRERAVIPWSLPRS